MDDARIAWKIREQMAAFSGRVCQGLPKVAHNRVSSFLCASEKAAIGVSLDVFRRLEESSPGVFCDPVGGLPLANITQRGT